MDSCFLLLSYLEKQRGAELGDRRLLSPGRTGTARSLAKKPSFSPGGDLLCPGIRRERGGLILPNPEKPQRAHPPWGTRHAHLASKKERFEATKVLISLGKEKGGSWDGSRVGSGQAKGKSPSVPGTPEELGVAAAAPPRPPRGTGSAPKGLTGNLGWRCGSERRAPPPPCPGGPRAGAAGTEGGSPGSPPPPRRSQARS